MDDPLRQRLGLGAVKLRVLAGDVGETVMGKVKGAEPFEGQQDEETASPPDPVVQRGGAEGRAMRAFMFQREQEDQRDPLHRQQRPPERNPRRDRRAKPHDQRDMARKMDQPREVAGLGQRRARGRGQGGQEGLVISHARQSGLARARGQCHLRPLWPPSAPRLTFPPA